MNDYEMTALHEGGHAIVWHLEGEHVGPLGLISAIPHGNAVGCVRGVGHGKLRPTHRTLVALGRINVAGLAAELLAGHYPPEETVEGDMQAVAELELLSGRGPQFRLDVLVGAEFLLRAHWGAVSALARWLGAEGCFPTPYADAVCRLALDEPQRPLLGDMVSLRRLLERVERVPDLSRGLQGELRAAIEAAS